MGAECEMWSSEWDVCVGGVPPEGRRWKVGGRSWESGVHILRRFQFGGREYFFSGFN
jgi:hypothetical protein